MAVTSSARVQHAQRVEFLRQNADRLVIDGDVHPTDRKTLPAAVRQRIESDANYYHGRPLLTENLFARMEQAGIDMALCWQNPAVLQYGDDQKQNAELLTAANQQIAALAREHPERVIPAGWTDPKALGVDAAIALARRCVEEFGMPVVKMNPAQNQYPIDSDEVAQVVDVIVGLGAVPAFHFGSDTPFTPAEGLARIAKRNPDSPVIGVHMGGGGGNFVDAEPTYQAARQIGLENPNIFFVLSAKRDVHIESALITYANAGRPFSRNLGAGSDAPYADMVFSYGAFRALFAALGDGQTYGDPRLAAKPDLFDEEMVSGFMGGNLARLIADASERILSRSDNQ
ncbi:amidohydrolase family protein [Aureimonas fodinaquatilis]|nr:amidohydrolase family protein [Aureimonas fodinaquatilis]